MTGDQIKRVLLFIALGALVLGIVRSLRAISYGQGGPASRRTQARPIPRISVWCRPSGRSGTGCNSW